LASVLGACQEWANVTGRIDDERSPIANLNEIGRVPQALVHEGGDLDQ
jgi:hypothetical protein